MITTTGRDLAVRLGLALGLILAFQAPAGPVFGGPSQSLALSVVVTDAGPVRGIDIGSHRRFFGLPYAAPPVGDLRWEPPQPVESWDTVRNAFFPGQACPQLRSISGLPSYDEDCLYLNVTTPRGDRGGHPVMVWLHGGAFISGSGLFYDPTRLVMAGDVVVVTINYRLGALGYLAHPSLLESESDPAMAGAWGIADQQAALRWVRRNIAAFGGDPNNVTLAGQSAGGMSVCAHLAAPGSAGLFHRAILESGPCTHTVPAVGPWAIPLADALSKGEELARRVGCEDEGSDAECLRAAPVADLLKAVGRETQLQVAYGNAVLPIEPADAIDMGHFNHVPVIVGSTRDEHRLYGAIREQNTDHPLTESEYFEEVEETFGSDADSVLAEYPVTRYDSPSLALATVLTDWAWSCPALLTAQTLAGQVRTWSYEFADDRAPWLILVRRPSFPTGAYHGSELRSLFDGPAFFAPLDHQQRELSEQMIEYWTRFARDGDPNSYDARPWETFTSVGSGTQVLAPGGSWPGRVNLDDEHRCGFWSDHVTFASP
jgi:para-nitrobenzyl esterase